MFRKSKKNKKLESVKAIVHDHDYSKIFPDSPPLLKTSKPDDIKSEFAFIRRLIKAKRFSEARYRLVNIDHPKADEWLDKLNRLDPDYSETVTLLLKPLFLIFVVIFLFTFLLYGTGQITVEVALGVGFMLGIISVVLLSLWSRQV